MDRYRRPLLRYLHRLVPGDRAEDVLQAAFVSAWTALREGVAVRDLRPWLYRICHNGAVNALARRSNDDVELHEALRCSSSPVEDLVSRDALRRTLASVAELPERQRAALLAVAVEGRPHGEVARELGMTDGALRQLVHRARSAVRSAVTAVTPAPLMEWLAQQGARGARRRRGREGRRDRRRDRVGRRGRRRPRGRPPRRARRGRRCRGHAALDRPRSAGSTAPRTGSDSRSRSLARPSPRRSSPSPAPARGPARRPHRARDAPGQAPPRRAPPPGGARDGHAQRLDRTGPDAARRPKRPSGATRALPRARPARDHTHGHGVDAPAPTARRVPRGRLPPGNNAHRAAPGDDAHRAAAGDRTAALGPPAHQRDQGSDPRRTPRYEGVCPCFAVCNRGDRPLSRGVQPGDSPLEARGKLRDVFGCWLSQGVTKAIRP